MNKTLLIVCLSLLSLSAFAGTNATLNLKGQVPVVLSLAITPEAVAANLQLDQTQTNLKIASGSATSNSSTGYKITIASANGGNLKRTDGDQLFPYSLKVGAHVIQLASQSEISGDGLLNSSENLFLSYTGKPAASMISGNYADTLTFTISAK